MEKTISFYFSLFKVLSALVIEQLKFVVFDLKNVILLVDRSEI